ncbi:hypothetical protein PQC18_gp59 [Streptomyces phage Pablito]|uniref:Uncharacterized protein n=1 Tax=Streptomyces phage Pablito TaxID=2894593 RepID=A0AAE9C7C2_9CAUD|nr:hypothetical protein PQC18_gp59 [Streptomyces phage Pablito]UFD97997.1 hypothetical protein [Streptomyces phage Pablito]
MSIIAELKKILDEHSEREIERDEHLAQFKDEEGEVEDWYGYDSARTAQDEADAEAYSGLIARLSELAGAAFKDGSRVRVAEGAQLASGGPVFFDGEVEGTVRGGVDEDGDILVEADNGVFQYVGTEYLTSA